MHIVEVGLNLFQFKFKTKFDMERVFKGGPWTFNKQVLLLRKWQLGMTTKNVRFDSVSLWVQIWDASFDMVSLTVAIEISRRMGVVEEVEKRYNKDGQNLFMRVKVAIPIAKLIRQGGFLAGSDGQKTWTTFRYERLPMFCHYCGLLGHDINHCANYFGLMKSGKEVQLQYREWLKASGGRQRVERTKFGRGNTVLEKENIQSEGLGKATAEEVDHANPSATEIREKGKSDNSGNAWEDGDCAPVFTGRDETYMELIPTDLMDGSREIMSIHEEVHVGLNSKDEGNVFSHESVHVEGMELNGPKTSKTRPTWTRLARMAYGEGNSSPTEAATMLGKRGLYQEGMDVVSELEFHLRKREKIQVDPKETAGVLEHPYRSQ